LTDQKEEETTSLSSIQEAIPESEYEAFDKFDFDDKYLAQLGNVLDKNDKLNKVGRVLDKQKEALAKAVKKRYNEVEKKMQYAPFWRKADKFAFMAGTSMIIAFSFIIGRYPHDIIYTFTSIMLPTLIATRYVHYILVGWHMYLVDFCYFANALMLYYILFEPKNETLMTSVFLYATGPLAIGIVAFRNSLVYHKIDFLTSLAIHAVPLVIAH
jgi:hypothetical protein